MDIKTATLPEKIPLALDALLHEEEMHEALLHFTQYNLHELLSALPCFHNRR